MAGNYPDVPSWRMAYDRDGTVGYTLVGSTITLISAAQLKTLNTEDNASVGPGSDGQWVGVIFPEHRDLDGYKVQLPVGSYSSALWTVQVSTDSTNGYDGVWTTLPLPPSRYYDRADMRNGIVAQTVLGVKAFRVNGNTDNFPTFSVAALHLYGEKVPNENLDRLEIWHPTLDQKVPPAYFDWGNAARASSATKTFRVKNISPTKTAQQVRVAMETLSDANPPLLGQVTMSLDGAIWLAQVNVGDLAPGQISQVVSIRRDTLPNAELSLFWFRVFAESTASWV